MTLLLWCDSQLSFLCIQEAVDDLFLKPQWWQSNDRTNHSNTSAHCTLLWGIFLQTWHKYGLSHSSYYADVEIQWCSHSVQQLFYNSCYGKPLHQQDNAETSIFCHDALEEWPVAHQSEVLNFPTHVQVSQRHVQCQRCFPSVNCIER